MGSVRPKKELGQHFLEDEGIARSIVDALDYRGDTVEVGPGMGVLSRYLFGRVKEGLTGRLRLVEVDGESVEYLERTYAEARGCVVRGDFLRMGADEFFGDADGSFAVIGNFPYNISSQIFFHILEFRDRVPVVVGMLQKEVAERLSSGPGSRDYGILSVFLQAYYDVEYLFTVDEDVFNPPPKVKSGVIRLRRNGVRSLGCDEVLFRRVVKATFGQRRKTIWNGLRSLGVDLSSLRDESVMRQRPEQLGVCEFVELTNMVSGQMA